MFLLLSSHQMCILYWQGGDYKIQETWAHAQYFNSHKWTLSGNSAMPCVWLGDTSVSIQHEQNVSELSHSGVWAINLGKYRTGRRARIQMYHSPSPTPEAPVPAPALPAPGQDSSWLWQSWGLGGAILPQATNTREAQEQHNTKMEPN